MDKLTANINKLLALLENNEKISISYIMRYLPTGYCSAVKYIEYLIDENYISPKEIGGYHMIYTKNERKKLKDAPKKRQ